MKDLYTVEKEDTEDEMMPAFNLEFDGMEVLYDLFQSFTQDLKLS